MDSFIRFQNIEADEKKKKDECVSKVRQKEFLKKGKKIFGDFYKKKAKPVEEVSVTAISKDVPLDNDFDISSLVEVYNEDSVLNYVAFSSHGSLFSNNAKNDMTDIFNDESGSITNVFV